MKIDTAILDTIVNATLTILKIILWVSVFVFYLDMFHHAWYGY